MEEKKTKYELAILAPAESKENELNEFLGSIEKEIEKSGDLRSKEEPKKISLRYPIKKMNEAYFSVFEFEMDPEKSEIFKKQLEKDKRIIRFLLIKKTEEKQKLRKSKRKEPILENEENNDKEEEIDLKKIEEDLNKTLS